MIVHPSVLKRHLEDILDIIYSQLGDEYTGRSEVINAIEYGGDRFISVAFPDMESDPPCQVVHSPPPTSSEGVGETQLPEDVHPVPVAVSIGCRFDSAGLASHLNFAPEEYPPSLSQKSPAGVLRAIAIHEDAPERGIINETISHTIDVLEQEDCEVQIFLAWRGKGGVQYYDIFNENNFDLRREFSEYWMEESIREGYKCPICGPPPCKCSALLFVRVEQSIFGL